MSQSYFLSSALGYCFVFRLLKCCCPQMIIIMLIRDGQAFMYKPMKIDTVLAHGRLLRPHHHRRRLLRPHCRRRRLLHLHCRRRFFSKRVSFAARVTTVVAHINGPRPFPGSHRVLSTVLFESSPMCSSSPPQCALRVAISLHVTCHSLSALPARSILALRKDDQIGVGKRHATARWSAEALAAWRHRFLARQCGTGYA